MVLGVITHQIGIKFNLKLDIPKNPQAHFIFATCND